MKQLHFHEDHNNLPRAKALRNFFHSNSADLELKTVRLSSKKSNSYDPGQEVWVTLGGDKTTALQKGKLGKVRIVRCIKLSWLSIGYEPSDFTNNLDGGNKAGLEINLSRYYSFFSKNNRLIISKQTISIITFIKVP